MCKRKYSRWRDNTMENKCYLCGAENYEVIHYGVRGNPDINVLKCKQCGLVFLSQFISDTVQFYCNSGMRKQEKDNIKKIRVKAYDDDHRRFQFTRNRIADKVVCDFGCGAGGYLLEAQTVASKVYGIELENTMYEVLNKGGVECFHSIDEAEKVLVGKVDVITMWHVLEHLENPIEILHRLQMFLKPNGIIYIEVPNADDALLSLYNSKSFADFTYWECHLYLYNNETLSKLVEKAGMKIYFQTQIQRYSLANHLYWLTNGMPGGHVQWDIMNREALDKEYEKMLVSLGKADTLIAEITSP